MAVTAEDAKLAEHFIYEELDLRRVRDLAKATYQWDDATVARAEASYRDFLWVCWNFARAETSMTWVSLAADKFGHLHLQDPAAFVADCAQIFGQGRALIHMPLYDGRLVVEADCATARSHYAALDLDIPSDLRTKCIWAVVSN